MMPVALVLFALAAAGGLTMLVQGFQEKEPASALVVGHGALAAVALVLVVVAVAGGSAGGLATVGLAVLVVAALGGFTVLLVHRKRKRLPLSLAMIHGLLAAAGVLLLLIWLLTA